MSNTAIPNATEARVAKAPGGGSSFAAGAKAEPAAGRSSSHAETIERVRTILGAAVLSMLLVTFTPFLAKSASPADQGNILNQLGYGSLGAIGVISHFVFTEKRVALALLRPSWLLIAGFLVLSIGHSAWPDNAGRAVLFSLMAMAAGSAAVTLPPNARALRQCLGIAALAVLCLSFYGIAALPAAAIHGTSGDEPQHAGLWRGIYAHKNIAGPVTACLFFAGLYILRGGARRLGWVVTILAGIFVFKTGSKTTAGLVPLVAVMIVGARIFGGRLLPAVILFVAAVALALLTLGAAISPVLDGVLQAILPGTTFTGRMDLWRFALELMEPRQWTGFGFESFWQTGIVENAEMPFELSWDPRGIVNSHSGYLDIAIAMGWPALAVAVVVLVLQPLADYVRCQPGIENERLADFFLMILAFTMLNSFLESYLFKRADPVWMLMWMSIVGLRLLSRFKISP